MTTKRSTQLFLACRDLGIVGQVIVECKNSFGQDLVVVEEKGHPTRLHALQPDLRGWYPLTHDEYASRQAEVYVKCPVCRQEGPED